jgi:Mn-dependent DtxR family transcriptional regulator
MAKKYRVTLTAEEREELQAVIAKGKASARKLAHARVLLQVDETEREFEKVHEAVSRRVINRIMAT